MNEFEIIQHYFQQLTSPAAPVADLGIGDDCALVQCPPGQQLAISADTLIKGVHFPEDASAADIGYKSLAVNLSDLAAMGANPAWFTLCLSLPEFNREWLQAFCGGMADLIAEAPINLIGGDTTRGPLSISIQVMGTLQSGQGLCRHGAKPGDDIYVSGDIGAAGFGLRHWQSGAGALEPLSPAIKVALSRLNRPSPRVALGRALIGLASSCIDVSDGLLADLNHLLKASEVGAEIELGSIPYAAVVLDDTPQDEAGFTAAQRFAINAGDDYELCFTAPVIARERIEQVAKLAPLRLSRVGVITRELGLKTFTPDGQPLSQPLSAAGYQHF